MSLQPDIAAQAGDDWLPASEIAHAVAGGKIAALSVTDAALARIAEHNPALNSFTDVVVDRRAGAGRRRRCRHCCR